MNKQDNREDDIQIQSVADLELTTEQAEQTKGGTLARHEGQFMGNLFSATPVAR